MLLIIIATAAGVVLIRRAIRLSGVAHPNLVGRWTSDFVPTEWGAARFILDIDRHDVVCTFDPVGGEPMPAADKYLVRNGTFQSPLLNSGDPITYRLDGNSLVFLDPIDGPTAFRKSWWSVIWP